MNILPDDIVQIILDCIEDQDEIVKVINTFDNFQQQSKFVYYTSNLIKNRIYLKEIDKYSTANEVWRSNISKIFNHSGKIEGFENDFYKNHIFEKIEINRSTHYYAEYNKSQFEKINPTIMKEINKNINKYKKFL